MGRRGPVPRSGVFYQGREVVIRAHGAPYVRLPSIIDEHGNPKKHPLAVSGGYVPVLRLAADDARLFKNTDGSPRPINRGDVVIPRDGDPWNWHPSNLHVKRLGDSLSNKFAKRARPRARVSRTPKAR